jgi:hypothetical protein
MVAFKKTVPANRWGDVQLVAGTAYNSVNGKIMSISTNPCDFSESLATNHCMVTGRADTMLYYALGSDTVGNSSHPCQLPSEGTVIYFNIKNGHQAGVPNNNTCPATLGGCGYYLYGLYTN